MNFARNIFHTSIMNLYIVKASAVLLILTFLEKNGDGGDHEMDLMYLYNVYEGFCCEVIVSCLMSLCAELEMVFCGTL